jgi:hypothetical protein
MPLKKSSSLAAKDAGVDASIAIIVGSCSMII